MVNDYHQLCRNKLIKYERNVGERIKEHSAKWKKDITEQSLKHSCAFSWTFCFRLLSLAGD